MYYVLGLYYDPTTPSTKPKLHVLCTGPGVSTRTDPTTPPPSLGYEAGEAGGGGSVLVAIPDSLHSSKVQLS